MSQYVSNSTNKLQSFLIIFERIIDNLSAIQLLDVLLQMKISTSLHHLRASDATGKACNAFSGVCPSISLSAGKNVKYGSEIDVT